MRIADAQATVENGTLHAEGSVQLGAAPAYRLSCLLDDMDFKGGKLDADAVLDTGGLGRQVLARLRAEGVFDARGLDVAPELKTVSGNFRLEWSARGPRLKFEELRTQVGADLYFGHGASQNDGRVLVELWAGPKQLRVIGTLAPLRADSTP